MCMEAEKLVFVQRLACSFAVISVEGANCQDSDMTPVSLVVLKCISQHLKK